MFAYLILGILDVLGGLLLIIGAFVPYVGSGFMMTVGGVFITKGILLFIYRRLGDSPYFDLGSLLDVLTGILLISMFMGFYSSLFSLLGLLMIIKGVVGFVKSVV